MTHHRLHLVSSSIALFATCYLLTAFGCGPNGSETPEDEAQVTITAPEDDGYVSAKRVTVEGTARGVSEVKVNGERVNVSHDHWDTVVEFDHEGEARVTATAEDAEDRVDFIIDQTKPEVELTAPRRGAFIDGDADQTIHHVEVEGNLGEVGPSGLLLLDINGQTIEPDDDGTFSDEITVHPGMNRITMHAIDRARNETKTNRALIYGPLSEPDASIDEALRVDILEPEGTDVIEEVIEEYLSPEQIEQFVVAALEDQGVPVELTDLDWSDLQIDLSTSDGTIDLAVTITDLFVEGSFQYDEDSTPFEAHIEIGQLDVEMSVALGAEEDQLTVEVVDDDIETQDVTVNVGGEDREWLEGVVELAIKAAFAEFVGDLVEDNLFDPDMLTHEVEFMDRTIELTLLLEDVTISSRGISIGLGFDFSHDRHPDVPEVPGALNRPVGSNPGFDVVQPFLFHSTRTTADRVGHAVWESGLFHQRVGNDDLSGISLPFDLTADGLGNIIDPQIRDVHDTNTPAAFGLRPLLPPVFEFAESGENNAGNVELGDFLVDVILLPGDGKETVVVTIALHLDVDIELQIEDNELAFDVDIDADGDLAATPEFDIDRESTVEFITDLIEIIPNFLQSDLSLDAQATMEWATIDNPTVQIHGDDNERITVGVDVSPAEDHIEDDDVEEPDVDDSDE